MDNVNYVQQETQLALERLKLYFPRKIKWVISAINKPSGVYEIIEFLNKKITKKDYFPIKDIQTSKARDIWNDFGYIYRLVGRVRDALLIYQTEYSNTIKAQNTYKKRIHKGAILYFISECFDLMNYHYSSKIYMMLALCEDSISYSGKPDPNQTGSYHKLVWSKRITNSQYYYYADKFWSIFLENEDPGNFPEWLLQNTDYGWVTEIPSAEESIYYVINHDYCKFLIKGLGKSKGKNLELVAQYLLSCIPGFLPRRRALAASTDYDVLCTVQGNYVDFRSDIGKYFIVECKDWNKPIGVSIVYKFYRVLKSVKSNFGILFSTKGNSGSNEFKDSHREIIKIFQSDGIVIIVISFDDIEKIINGENLITLLRNMYENIRFDLSAL